MVMIETDNTRAARAMLAEHTDKPVEVRPITELRVPGRTGPVTYLWGYRGEA